MTNQNWSYPRQGQRCRGHGKAGTAVPSRLGGRGVRAVGRRPPGVGYCRGVRTTSLIQAFVLSSRGPAILLSLAARSALIFCSTIRPSPAKTAAATTGSSDGFGFLSHAAHPTEPAGGDHSRPRGPAAARSTAPVTNTAWCTRAR